MLPLGVAEWEMHTRIEFQVRICPPSARKAEKVTHFWCGGYGHNRVDSFGGSNIRRGKWCPEEFGCVDNKVALLGGTGNSTAVNQLGR